MDVREELERQMWEVDEDMNLYPSNIDRIVELSNQRVIAELEAVLDFNMKLPDDNKYMSVMNTAQLELAKRIHNLKENQDE
jgi:hypothetical protein